MPITILDLALLAVMLISGLLAMVRGFMREILSIAAWGAAALVTLYAFGKLLPTATTECLSCHSQHGAVDNTFVQFYPTLLEVAKTKGTVKSNY